MSYVVGEEYVGLTADDYDAIIDQGNETINQWLEANMTPVAGGMYYICTGDGMDLIEILEPAGAADFVNYFAFLGSSWSMIGI